MTVVAIRVDRPRVDVAGADARHDAHVEVRPHRLALRLSPDELTESA